MEIRISDWQQIISNPCGGFDYREAKRNKETSELLRRENGKPYWTFIMYMPTIGQLLVKIHDKQWHIGTESETDILRIIEESRRIEAVLLAAVQNVIACPIESKPRRPSKTPISA